MSEGTEQSGGIAPADAKAHGAWPAWKKWAWYGVFAALAAGSIWIIDDHVQRIAKDQAPAAGTKAAGEKPAGVKPAGVKLGQG